MRFLALLKKEFRECLPWMVPAAIFFFVFGGLALRSVAAPENVEYHYRFFSPFSELGYYDLARSSPLSSTGPLMFLTSVGIGLALGIRQFWVAHFTKTWGFTLHRSVSRETILAAKLAAAITVFLISIGTIWFYFWWYANRPGYFPVPPPTSVFIEGWLFIAVGFVFYLGAALAGLSRAKWYTTKIFGLAFALWIFVTITAQWKLAWAFSAMAVGIVVLLLQIFDTFLNREF